MARDAPALTSPRRELALLHPRPGGPRPPEQPGSLSVARGSPSAVPGSDASRSPGRRRWRACCARRAPQPGVRQLPLSSLRGGTRGMASECPRRPQPKEPD